MTDVYEARGPVPVPPPLVYLAGFGVGLLIGLAASPPDLPTAVRVTGGVAGVVVLLALDTSAMRRFIRRGTPVNPARAARALVTDGPYRFTRNPMYLGMACAYAGAALAAGALWSLAVLPAVLLVVDRVIIAREERHLVARFGDQYERYRRSVRRWI